MPGIIPVDDLTSGNFITVDYRRQLIEFKPRMWNVRLEVPDRGPMPQVKGMFWRRTLNKINWIVRHLLETQQRAKLVLIERSPNQYHLIVHFSKREFPFLQFVKDLQVQTYGQPERIPAPGLLFNVTQTLIVTEGREQDFRDNFIIQPVCEVQFIGIDQNGNEVAQSPHSILADIDSSTLKTVQ